jgi:hypothetical protein
MERLLTVPSQLNVPEPRPEMASAAAETAFEIFHTYRAGTV